MSVVVKRFRLAFSKVDLNASGIYGYARMCCVPATPTVLQHSRVLPEAKGGGVWWRVRASQLHAVQW